MVIECLKMYIAGFFIGMVALVIAINWWALK
jgi:hypothetical protein